MIAASVAYAEMRARNRLTVGRSALQREVDLGVLFDLYGSQIRRTSKSSFELDVPESYLEPAWVGDWEASYDIAHQQLLTYAHALTVNRHPAWTAVTGYYAGFFAARALLYGTGIAHRGLPKRGPMGGGLYELRISSTPPTLGSATITCTSMGGGGSHKAAWRSVGSLLTELVGLGGLDLHSTDVLTSSTSLISTPRHVSAFRNQVNYSLDMASSPLQPWPSEFRRVKDTQDLEHTIRGTAPDRDENRIELLTMACLSWTRSLYEDYLGNADRPDRRRLRSRSQFLAEEPEEIQSLVRGWVSA